MTEYDMVLNDWVFAGVIFFAFLLIIACIGMAVGAF